MGIATILEMVMLTRLDCMLGAAAEDPAIDPRDFLGPEAYEAAAGVVEDTCLGEVIAALVPVAASPDFYVTDPRTDPVGSLGSRSDRSSCCAS